MRSDGRWRGWREGKNTAMRDWPRGHSGGISLSHTTIMHYVPQGRVSVYFSS